LGVRVALTGAFGYTGGRLLAALAARGESVSALVRSRSKRAELSSSGVRVVEGDLTEAAALARLVEGAEAVVHVATVYRTAGHSDDYYRDVNVGGTERLLEAAARAGVGCFVHASTIGVHGHIEHPPADETAPFAPGDIYQETEAEAECLALSFPREGGLPVTVVRPGAIYGPGERRLLKAVCVPLGVEPPLHRRRVDFCTRSRAFSIEKARRRLGYAPAVDLEEGLGRTAAWYREAGWL